MSANMRFISYSLEDYLKTCFAVMPQGFQGVSLTLPTCWKWGSLFNITKNSFVNLAEGNDHIFFQKEVHELTFTLAAIH